MSRAFRLVSPSLALLALASCCGTSTSAGKVILSGTAETALFAADFGETVFWEIPKLVLTVTPSAAARPVARP